MAKKIIILSKSKDLPTIKALENASQNLHFDFATLNPCEEFTPEINKYPVNKGDLVITRSSGINFDDIDLLFAEQALSKGAILHMPILSQRTLRNKDQQYFKLNSLNLPTIKTFCLRGAMNEKVLGHFKKECAPYLEVRGEKDFVTKSIRGNKGIGVERHTENELIIWWNERFKSGDQRYIIQPHIDHQQSIELRSVVMGPEQWVIIKDLTKNDDWKRNSTSSQFRSLTYDEFENLELGLRQKLEKEIELINNTLKEKLSLKSFAIDFLLFKKAGKYTLEILEVNGNPGWSALAQALKKEEKDLALLYLQSFL